MTHVSSFCRGLGHMFVKSDEKVGDIIPRLVKRSGLPQDSSIDLYEVSKIHDSTPIADPHRRLV